MTQPFPPNCSHSASPTSSTLPLDASHERELPPDLSHPIPRIVYKYLDSTGGRIALHEHTIKYTSIRHFNDPFECMFGYFSQTDVDRFLAEAEAARPNRDKWDAFCNKYWQIIPDETVARENWRSQTNRELLHILDELYDTVQRKLLSGFEKTLAVASFSERKDSILMWSHYAQQHKGIVIGYDTACFRSILPGGTSLYRVNYADTRIDIPLSADVAWGTLDRLATTKYRDWIYEHEWRSVFHDNDEEMGNLVSVFPQISTRYIREVCIGVHADFETERACRQYCAVHPECSFSQPIFHKTDYALDFDSI